MPATTCPTCKGQGVCQKCHGRSAIEHSPYGGTYVKYPIRSKIVDGVNVALSEEEYKRVNDPANVPSCDCANGGCPQCGHTGKIMIPN